MMDSSEYAQLAEDGKDDATLLAEDSEKQESHGLMLQTIEIDSDEVREREDGLTQHQRSVLQQRAHSKLQWRLKAAYCLFGGLVLFGFTVSRLVALASFLALTFSLCNRRTSSTSSCPLPLTVQQEKMEGSIAVSQGHFHRLSGASLQDRLFLGVTISSLAFHRDCAGLRLVG